MKQIFFITLLSSFFLMNCTKDGKFNVFTIKDDIAFGSQLDSLIVNSPEDYPLLPRVGYEEVYDYVEGIMYKVLESNDVKHRDDFPWQVRIINQNILNAFAAPGGYLYFYTGFLKYAESEAEFAGVMAHEVAHSDHRHSTTRLTKLYGFQVLFSILLGNNPSQLQQIAAQLAMGGAALSFSRKDEYEADASAVKYLHTIRAKRNYEATAIIDFFDRMQADSLSQGSGSFEFLRTHPYDENRKANITQIWKDLGSPQGQKFENEHTRIVGMLP